MQSNRKTWILLDVQTVDRIATENPTSPPGGSTGSEGAGISCGLHLSQEDISFSFFAPASPRDYGTSSFRSEISHFIENY